MKKFILAIFLLHIGHFMASAQNPDAILGIWHSPHVKNDIQITKKDNKYYGETILIKEHNGHQHSALDTGIVILRDFQYRARGSVYFRGRVLDSKSGRIYNGQLKLLDNDRLDVRIFFGIIQFGKTETWIRVVQ